MNFSKSVRDRAIPSKFFTHRVVQVYPNQRGKISIFATFGGPLGSYWNLNIENISGKVRDRAISSKFLTCRVVQEYPVPRGEISIFTTFVGHLGFQQKMKKCEYLQKCKR